MAARQSTSGANARRNHRPGSASAAALRRIERRVGAAERGRNGAALPNESGFEPQSLEQAIESERGRLGAAQSVLRCLHAALLYCEENNKNAASYAEVASIALRLIRESVHRLDSLHVKPLVEALRDGNGKSSSGRQAPALRR